MSLLLIFCLLGVLTACAGTLEVGIERTPTPPPPWGGRSGVICYGEGAVSLCPQDEEQPLVVGSLPTDAGYVRLGAHHLAYTSDSRIQALDLRDGTTILLHDVGQRPGQQISLGWSNDGSTLAYTVAWDESDGSRRIELGITDGYEQRIVDRLIGQPAAPPSIAKPGLVNLEILGYDRVQGQLIVRPLGWEEVALWVYDTHSGERSYTLTLPEDTLIIVLAPHTYQFAIALPGELQVWALAAGAEPQRMALPSGTHAGWFCWSPDSRRLAYLLHEGTVPGLDVSASLGLWVWEIEEGRSHPLVQQVSPEAALHGWTTDGAALLLESLEGIGRRHNASLVDARTGAITHMPPLCEGCRIVGWYVQP
jgi:hypothetical protein